MGEDGKIIIGTVIDDSGIKEGLDDIEDEVESRDIELDLNTEKEKKETSVLSSILSKIGGKILGISASSVKLLGTVLSGIAKMGTIGGLLIGIIGLIAIIGKEVIKNLKENERFKESVGKLKYLFQSVVASITQALSSVTNEIINVINIIMDLLVKAILYIGYLLKAWFGVNIFSENVATNIENANASAKELKKTLSGFDEMNVLTDSSSGAGGTSPTAGIDPIKVKEITDLEAPEWLQTIKDIGLWILDNWEDVIGTLLLVKLVIDLLTGNWIGVVIDILGFIVLAFYEIGKALGELGDALCELWDRFVQWWKSNALPFFDNIFKKIGQIFSDLWQGIVNEFKREISAIKDGFATAWIWIKERFINPMKQGFNEFWEALKSGPRGFTNYVIGKIEGMINNIIDGINWLIGKINKINIDVPDWVPAIGGSKFGFNIGKIGQVSIPRLARGGIVNMPGKGLPIGNAYAGERGAEGVIPLTDNQQMALLGEAIGKYITINANITNTMNGRVISRELQKVQNESNFATNR